MQAVILCAGKSTRTRPLTVTRPKPLLKFMNKTILEHNLEQLKGIVDEVIIVVGYMRQMIKEKFGDNYKGMKITYVEQMEQLGTGHALLCAEDFLKGIFIILSGDDVFSGKDLARLAKEKYACLADRVENPSQFGIFETKGDMVISVEEKPKKPKSDLANTACWVMDKEIIAVMKDIKKSKRGEYELTSALNEFAKKKEVKLVKVEDYYIPITYSWSLLKANEFFVSKIQNSDIKGEVEKNVTVKGNIIVGKGTIIKNGTYIEGNAVFGTNCIIGPNCYIRGNTSVGDGCKIGNACEVKNSIFFDGVSVGHLSYIGDTIIGENTNLGAGTITANLKHDNSNVKSVVNGELVDTGRRKLGAIIGDRVHTGIHTSIYPGRNIWPDKSTLPGEVVKADVSEE